VNETTEKLIHSNELTKLLKPQNYCGILLIDGKYVPVKKLEGKDIHLRPVAEAVRASLIEYGKNVEKGIVA